MFLKMAIENKDTLQNIITLFHKNVCIYNSPERVRILVILSIYFLTFLCKTSTADQVSLISERIIIAHTCILKPQRKPLPR